MVFEPSERLNFTPENKLQFYSCYDYGVSKESIVLGVHKEIQKGANDDFNAFLETGIYWWASNADVPQTNKPSDLGGGSMCLVYRGGSHILQIAVNGYYNQSGLDRIYFRVGYLSENAIFHNWNSISFV